MMDKLIDLINQGGTGEYDARQERGEAVAWAHVATMNGVDFVQYPLYLTEQDAKWSIGNYAEGSKVRIEPLTFLHPAPDAGRVAELEQKLSEQRRISVELNDQCVDYCRRIAALEAQLADMTAARDLWMQRHEDMEREALAARAQLAESRERLALAYGLLWHVNAGIDAPWGTPSLTPERAAMESRKLLRDMLTNEQRGDGINAARDFMKALATDKEQTK